MSAPGTRCSGCSNGGWGGCGGRVSPFTRKDSERGSAKMSRGGRSPFQGLHTDTHMHTYCGQPAGLQCHADPPPLCPLGIPACAPVGDTADPLTPEGPAQRTHWTLCWMHLVRWFGTHGDAPPSTPSSGSDPGSPCPDTPIRTSSLGLGCVLDTSCCILNCTPPVPPT